MTKEKNQAELEIEALADVFNIATEGFEEFLKKAEKSDKGDSSTAASSGDSSTAASSGDSSTAASSGDYSKAASSGNSSTAASSGSNSACAAVGYRAAVQGDMGNLLMASEYIQKDGKIIPIGGKADIVDGKKLKPQRWYIVENAEWVEVDFSDGIFSRVISTRGNVKKVKTDSDEVLYVASDDKGNHAHAPTMREALQELAFKTDERDIEQYRNMPLDTKKTPTEWGIAYRMVTGACQSGTKMFMQSKGKLKKHYTLAEILEQTRGAFGHDVFSKVTRGEE